MFLSISCQVTETLTINADGSGIIEKHSVRDENSYMQLAGENYTKENVFVDTTYVFDEYIQKYNANFIKYLPEEQALFATYKNAKVHLKKNSFEKEFFNTVSLAFQKVNDIPDLYKIQEYAADIKNNYALTAEEHYYRIQYCFDGVTFKRNVVITNATHFQNQKDIIAGYKSKLQGFDLVQNYLLNYHFPKKIKSVSNSNAVVSADKKSVSISFLLSDCLVNPESTNLEVVLEN